MSAADEARAAEEVLVPLLLLLMPLLVTGCEGMGGGEHGGMENKAKGRGSTHSKGLENAK